MQENNIILTGIPRSGTTLSCYLLSQTPDCVALNEPMRTAQYKTYQSALQAIPGYFKTTRDSILNRGVAVARASKGKMTDNHFSTEKGVRKKMVRKQEIEINKELSPNFNLAIKHNALFSILLHDLAKDFPVFAFVRNPLAVLGSWNSLDLPVSNGKVRATKFLLPDFDRALSKIPDLYDKQLFILNWYFEQYLHLPSEKVIKYEDLTASNGSVLSLINPKAKNIVTSLKNKNKNAIYNKDILLRLSEKLIKSDIACWQFYDKSDIEAIL